MNRPPRRIDWLAIASLFVTFLAMVGGLIVLYAFLVLALIVLG